MEHRPELLTEMLRAAAGPIPDYIRPFLADLAAGKVSRGKGGRPSERDGWVERSILAEVFREWETAKGAPRPKKAASPKETACAIVAARREITEGAVRGIVNRLRKFGYTLDAWKSWGRPNWKRIT
jgi:hypothetical protein